MKGKSNHKKKITVTCFYRKDGKEAAELIKKSFVLYLKSETVKAAN